jgi:hypothetical protein
MYKNDRFACVTATLSQPQNLKNPPRNFFKVDSISLNDHKIVKTGAYKEICESLGPTW